MGMGKERSCKIFGEIAPEATEKGAKYQLLFVMNTTHLFGHFLFTDFRVTWQECVNQCADEYFHSVILRFFSSSVAFLQKTDFSVASVNFGSQ